MILGIKEAIFQIEKIKDELPFVMANLMKEVAEYGQKQAQMYLEHVDTGETLVSIDYDYTPTSATVRAGGAAIWIEFGTGITKQPYPFPLPPGIEPHGGYGKGHGANPNGWWYPDPIGGAEGMGQVWYHTMGIDSNPFMTMALYDMIEFIEKRGFGVVAKGVL